ncbi:hypothetical protein EMIHUDRAFT_442036, partial [Emiliania huxleyi CCMP1516]|uniref:SnoaL-like domain-containing protein n=2 Tax=Emiliania huxleyi TaxID=2903 RepID=A0A0D3K821_EMIH1
MPIDEEGHRHLHLELRQRRAKRVFLRIDVRVRTLLMWLLLLLSIGSASALRVGAAVRPPAGFHKPHQPARTISSAPRHGGPAPARLEAAHLTHLLEALSTSGEAAAALFSEKVEYEDMVVGMRAVGIHDVIGALRHHPHIISDSLPRKLLGAELPRLRLSVESTATVDGEAVIEWQAELGGVPLALGRGITKMQLCNETGKVCRVVDVSEAPWRAAGKAAVGALRWAQERLHWSPERAREQVDESG